MFTVNDFNIIYADENGICTIVNSINDIDYEKVDSIILSSWDNNRWRADLESVFKICFFYLQTDSPEVELRVNYSGVDFFYSVEKIPFDQSIENTLNQALNRINNSFDEELFAFYNSTEWFNSQIFDIMMEQSCYSNSISEINQFYIQLADAVETNDLGFRLDSVFRRRLTKHITLKPNEEIKIDVDAFIHEKIIKYKGVNICIH